MELEFLIGNRHLTEDQLAKLQAELLAIETQDPTRLAVLGERGVGYREFLRMGAGPAGGSSKPDRPMDCVAYLDMMNEMLAVADMPAPDRMQALLRIESQLAAKANSLDPWKRSSVSLSLLAAPAVKQLLVASTRLEAERDSAVAGLAFRRFQLRHGRAPTSLAELTPDVLTAVPSDPFRRGAPLIFLVKGNQFAIYSVWMNGTDDQALFADPDTQDDTGLSGSVAIPAAPMQELPMSTNETSQSSK